VAQKGAAGYLSIATEVYSMLARNTTKQSSRIFTRTETHHWETPRFRGDHLAVLFLSLLVLVAAAKPVFARENTRKEVQALVAQIQRADYEGNRPALKNLFAELQGFRAHQELATQVSYWRGFALWRRAINGFNESVAPTELQADLQQALDEFNAALKNDPAFIDAKIGALSCTSFLAYSVSQQESGSTRIEELKTMARQLRMEIENVAPDNPRFLWVEGPIFWNVPPEHGGGQARAIELYNKGLATIHSKKTAATDSLDPSWGEPELLMSLSWSYLNQKTPDLGAAEQNARAALTIVPYWHYVKDILLLQIQKAQNK
jgi:hypothetical protein